MNRRRTGHRSTPRSEVGDFVRWPAKSMGLAVMAAADAMDAAVASFAVTLEEYAHDLQAADAHRDRKATFALVERIRMAGEDDDAILQHTETFLEALARIQADRRVERRRYWMTTSNLETVTLLAEDLRRFAQTSDALSLQAQSVISDAMNLLRSARSTRNDSNERTK